MKKFSIIALSLLTTLPMVCGAGEVAQSTQSSFMSTLGSYAATAAGYALKNGSKAMVWAAKGIADITGKPALFAGAAGAAAYGWYYKKQMNKAQGALNAAQAFLDKLDEPRTSAEVDPSMQMINWRRSENQSVYARDGKYWERADLIRADRHVVAYYLGLEAPSFDVCRCKDVSYSQRIEAACSYEQSLIKPLLEQLRPYASVQETFDAYRKEMNIAHRGLQDLDTAQMRELEQRIVKKLSLVSGHSLLSAPASVVTALVYPYTKRANKLYWELYNHHERLEAIKLVVRRMRIPATGPHYEVAGKCGKINCGHKQFAHK